MLDDAQIQAHVDKIARDGYTIVEDAIEPDFVDALAGRPGAPGARARRRSRRATASRARRPSRIYNLLVYGELYERIPVHEHVLPIVEGVLDPGCLVSSLSSIAIGPGETPQPIHADDQLIPIPKPHAPIVCNTMWALTDFTEANGATRIIPGSHLRDHSPDYGARLRQRSRPRCRRAACSSGTAACGTAAAPTAPSSGRVGIAMNYCAGYIRQQENQQLGIPREIARGFSPRLQRAGRLRRLQRPDRPHRQAATDAAARTPRRRRRWCGTLRVSRLGCDAARVCATSRQPTPDSLQP